MGKRRKAREVALQFLYQLEQNGASDPTPFEVEFWERHPVDDEAREFASSLVHGAKRRQPEIDKRIAESTEHWDLDRLAVVDRNILRVAVYELLFEPGVPGKVAINEAIEIAKRYGTNESSAFVNGILDRCKEELGKK
jgi:transcription antitermination protein NusB